MTSADVTILLDLDGTLVDSRPGIVASLHAALRALGHEPDPALDLTFAIGPPIAEAVTLLLRRYGDDRVPMGVAAYRAHYGAAGILDSRVYPGIAEALTALRSVGKVCVATSKRTDFAHAMLQRLALADAVTGVYGTEPSGALDRKDALIAHVLASESIRPEHAVMIGDRREDIAGAHANHVRAVGVLWGYGSRAELLEAGADVLAPEPHDLTAVVLRLLVDR
jgi:phosphoglycolate phosphatase